MERRRLAVLLVLLAVLLVGCDHATKLAAVTALPREGAVALVPGVLDLRYAENHDTAFTVFRNLDFPGKRSLLTGLALLATLAVGALAWQRRRTSGGLEKTAYALVLAGAAGNVLDRAARGFVVDFIHLRYWPVFNVADILVVLGGLLLVAARLRRRPAPSVT